MMRWYGDTIRMGKLSVPRLLEFSAVVVLVVDLNTIAAIILDPMKDKLALAIMHATLMFHISTSFIVKWNGDRIAYGYRKWEMRAFVWVTSQMDEVSLLGTATTVQVRGTGTRARCRKKKSINPAYRYAPWYQYVS